MDRVDVKKVTLNIKIKTLEDKCRELERNILNLEGCIISYVSKGTKLYDVEIKRCRKYLESTEIKIRYKQKVIIMLHSELRLLNSRTESKG